MTYARTCAYPVTMFSSKKSDGREGDCSLELHKFDLSLLIVFTITKYRVPPPPSRLPNPLGAYGASVCIKLQLFAPPLLGLHRCC